MNAVLRTTVTMKMDDLDWCSDVYKNMMQIVLEDSSMRNPKLQKPKLEKQFVMIK